MSDDLGNKSSSEDLKKKILSSMNTTFTGDATNRWITAMKDEAFDEMEEAVVPATESSKLNHSMAAVIDRLFDNFKRYSFEYNRTQDDREYEINAERPASMRTNAEYLEMGKPIKYCLGHLASRHWAMIIQGEENRILVFITPVEYLVGFRPSPTEFPPHMDMRLSRDTGKTSREFVWSIGGQMLCQDSLPVLARRLFTQLVKVTKGEATYGEPFSLSPQEEKLALAHSASAPVDRTFEEDETTFLGQKKPDLSERTFVVAAEQVEQLSAAMNEGTFPYSTASVAERPPLNAMLSPNPQASSLSASSSYPQVAAAIANGEPKALNPPPDPVAGFPTAQSMSEQSQTLQKIPNPTLAHTAVSMQTSPYDSPQVSAQAPPPVFAPAKTFMVEPGQTSGDEAIAALIFPAPPGEQVPSAESAPIPAPVPVPVPGPGPETAHAADAAPAHANPVAALPEAQAAPPPVAADQSAPTEALPASPWVGPNGEPARVPTASRSSIEMNIRPSNEAGKNNGQSGLAKETAEAKANIAQSLKGLFETVDSAINGLTAVGMTAMHADDLSTVSAVMKHTKSLKSLRDSVVALSKDWQKSIDEKEG